MSILTLAAKAVSAVRCDDMATTSIWRVKGWLGKVVIYVENPDKTENPAFYEKQEMTDRQTQGLSDVIDYAVSSEKTNGRMVIVAKLVVPSAEEVDADAGH